MKGYGAYLNFAIERLGYPLPQAEEYARRRVEEDRARHALPPSDQLELSPAAKARTDQIGPEDKWPEDFY